jgi:hypothetical protein
LTDKDDDEKKQYEITEEYIFEDASRITRRKEFIKNAEDENKVNGEDSEDKEDSDKSN